MSLRILHVTESMASGTMEIIAELALAQAGDGNVVHVAYFVRTETPTAEVLSARFGPCVSRSVLPPLSSRSIASAIGACAQLRSLIHEFGPDILHLHSSKAGAVGRIVCQTLRRKPRVFYSPHGLSFLRQDVSGAGRWLFRMVEGLLARLGGTVVACSPSEADIARSALGALRIAMVENAVAAEGLPRASFVNRDRRTVVTSGRLCYQKAPWRFFELARSLHHSDVDFVWIGDGRTVYPGMDSGPVPVNVRITGWMPRDAVVQLLSECDVYVLLSLWEGMPLVLIEAQAIGLPAVVSDCVGSRDVVVQGETGYICQSEADWTKCVADLLSDHGLRVRLGRNASGRARERYDVPRMHRQFMNLYTRTQV